MSPEVAWLLLALFLAGSIAGLLLPSSRFGISGTAVVLGCAFCLALGVAGANGTLSLPAFLGIAGVEVSLRIDALSRWFLGIIGVVGLPVAIYVPGYLAHLRGRARPGLVWSGLALLFASMSGVVLAQNAVVFIAFWELMALSSFLLVATEHGRQGVRRAAFIYLGATRIGSGFLVVGFLWMHALSHSWEFQAWYATGASGTVPAALMLVGLLTKAGSWPFHLWLPIAHPAAPGPVSAVMSGVMIKTAVYAVARLFVFGGIHQDWAGWALLGVGTVSAIWGILFGLLQGDLKRLLAYSSVENVGLILLALGTAVIARSFGIDLVASLALAAGLFHALNHAVFKSLWFLGASTVDANAHTREMDRLGGLIHRMPWTGAAVFVGTASICALAPLNGFAGEWLLYQSFFQMAARAPSGELRLLGLLLMGWLGLVGALAFVAFVKAFGISFLGRARSAEARNAREAGPAMVGACVFLALLCVTLGLGAPWILNRIGQMGLVSPTVQWSLPIVPVIAAGGVLTALAWVLMKRLAAIRPGRTFLTWDCGFGPLSARTQYSATSFSQPIARMFGALYHYEIHIAVEGKSRRHFPAQVQAESRHEAYLESKVYAPTFGAVTRLSQGLVMRLQAGSIHQYLLFIVFTLVMLLWLGGML